MAEVLAPLSERFIAGFSFWPTLLFGSATRRTHYAGRLQVGVVGGKSAGNNSQAPAVDQSYDKYTRQKLALRTRTSTRTSCPIGGCLTGMIVIAYFISIKITTGFSPSA